MLMLVSLRCHACTASWKVKLIPSPQYLLASINSSINVRLRSVFCAKILFLTVLADPPPLIEHKPWISYSLHRSDVRDARERFCLRWTAVHPFFPKRFWSLDHLTSVRSKWPSVVPNRHIDRNIYRYIYSCLEVYFQDFLSIYAREYMLWNRMDTLQLHVLLIFCKISDKNQKFDNKLLYPVLTQKWVLFFAH